MDTNTTQKPQITIYSTPSCHFCHMAKDFFNEKNIIFTDYNVAEDADKRQELIDKSGQRGVPVILIGDQMVIGFNKPKIVELLGL